jgi:Lon protease-like protein
MSEDPFPLSGFGGTARLFPLPNLVLFPHVVQPLHIFEPRYRQMLIDALADDRLLALALLRPGWEEDYHKRPPIHDVVCLGRILQEERLADGRWNLLLHGLSRARVLGELPPTKPYRVGRLELLSEVPAAVAREPELRRRLGQQVGAWFTVQGQAAAPEQVERLLSGPLTLGTIIDVLAFALPLGEDIRQTLLAELDVGCRLERFLGHLAACPPASPPAAAGPRRFPPEFSSN